MRLLQNLLIRRFLRRGRGSGRGTGQSKAELGLLLRLVHARTRDELAHGVLLDR